MPTTGITHYFAYLALKTANHTARHRSTKYNKNNNYSPCCTKTNFVTSSSLRTNTEKKTSIYVILQVTITVTRRIATSVLQ